jgi:hypothetical protein
MVKRRFVPSLRSKAQLNYLRNGYEVIEDAGSFFGLGCLELLVFSSSKRSDFRIDITLY